MGGGCLLDVTGESCQEYGLYSLCHYCTTTMRENIIEYVVLK